jgi:predicted DNA-binding protein
MTTYGYLGRKIRHSRTDRTETLSFRCSEELKVKVDEEVEKLGVSKADFLERAIEAALVRGIKG